ncbi:AMP-binding protein, partial [Achromobacter dolens]
MHALTLPSLLRDQAARQGTRPWIQAPGGALRYAEAPEHAARWAALLAQAGVGRGDRVGLMAGNRIEFMSLVLGCGWLGAVVVPINTASRGMQLQHILANSGCVLLVADRASCPALAGLDAAGLALRQIWLLDDGADGSAAAASGLPAPAAALPALPDGLAPEADLGPGDTLAILYTSGTSGLSKGVCCPHAQFHWWGVIAARNLEIGADDVLYTSLPLFHTNALNACFQALATGASIVCDERFSVSRYFERLAATGATVTYLLGAMVPM